MATPKVSDDQKPFEIVCYMLIPKAAKFLHPTPVSELYQKDHLRALIKIQLSHLIVLIC